MKMKNDRNSLISVEQFRELARPTSMHLEGDEVEAYVREAEDRYIIPAIGYHFFKVAVGSEQSAWDFSFDGTFRPTILLDGGEWKQKGKNRKETIRYCNGLRKALAYYTYAVMVRADGAIVTRAGNMRHRDDYSDHVDDSKLREYNDTVSMAELYLSECLEYMKYHKRPNATPKAVGTRSRIKAIGD